MERGPSSARSTPVHATIFGKHETSSVRSNLLRAEDGLRSG
jgi:hypothetical protein